MQDILCLALTADLPCNVIAVYFIQPNDLVRSTRLAPSRHSMTCYLCWCNRRHCLSDEKTCKQIFASFRDDQFLVYSGCRYLQRFAREVPARAEGSLAREKSGHRIRAEMTYNEMRRVILSVSSRIPPPPSLIIWCWSPWCWLRK